MKIEGNGPNPDNLAAQKLERAQAEANQVAAEKARKSADRVELSSDAALATAALKAASDAPDIRPEVVERMKKAMAAGEVGNDAQALADSLIKHMLEEK